MSEASEQGVGPVLAEAIIIGVCILTNLICFVWSFFLPWRVLGVRDRLLRVAVPVLALALFMFVIAESPQCGLWLDSSLT